MMAIPESEEVDFKRVGLSASDYGASLPIKKRRFSLVQSPPSPSKEISSSHLDGKLVKTEQSSSSKDISSQSSTSKDIPSVHPNGNLLKTEEPSPSKDIFSFHPDENSVMIEQPGISVTTVSSSSALPSYGLSNKNQDCVSEKNKGKSDTDSCYLDMVQSKIGMGGVEFQRPSLGGHVVDYEEKPLETEKHTVASPDIPGELKLSSDSFDLDPLASNKEEEITLKSLEEKCRSPTGQVEGKAALTVDLKGHMVQKLATENNDINLSKQNTLEPVLLDLSLSKQGSSSPCVRGNMGNAGSDYNDSLMHSNRENWDLNTSMESWEGCTSDAPAVQISATQTNTDVGTYVCSSEMVQSDSPCGKETPLDSEPSKDPASMPSKDHLHLSLNSSYPEPMLEEDPYISDYESDGNWDLADAVDYDDNDAEEDYEDGEVRETMLENDVEVHLCDKKEVEPFDNADCDDVKINSVGLPDHDSLTLGLVKQETKPENLDAINEDDVHTSITTLCKSSEQVNEDLCVKELHAVENTISEDINRPVKATGGTQLSLYDRKDNFEGQATADKTIDGIQELIPEASQGEVENAIAVDVVQNKDVALPNVKESVNSDDAKDVNGGAKNSRIINPNQASLDATPCKAKFSFVKSVLSRPDRQSVPNVALKEANVHPQERDDTYGTIDKKISVDRNQDQTPWMNFSRRRGRNTNRLDTRSREWDFGPNFSPEAYCDQQNDYHVPGLDQNRYDIIPDGHFGGASRHGRQLLDEEGPFFFHGPSRRKSPGRRHGPGVRGGKMVNRIPRDFSPSRCMDDGGSFDRQHDEKFTRNFPDETVDPIYTRPQPPYEVDRPFFRERRNFSFQRKGFPKSPVRSRARSPGQWFPSKRSDRFCGRAEMTHRRSPNYRTDRMRSLDQRPIGGHMTARRHGFRFLSPSDDMRDVGPAPPDHGHMRPIIPNRNQTERLSLRNRSYDSIDPRGRIESDELFDGPVRSGQLSACSGGDQHDAERRFNERHEPLHSFKHPYEDSDAERFRNNVEECSRPFRFCGENESRISWKRR